MDERRKFPRVNKNLPIKLSDHEFDILTETKNISANGAYCPVDRPLALMTKLDIVLLVAIPRNKSKVLKKIKCHGVVVRNEYVSANNGDNGKYHYRAAIYFNDLKERDRKVLSSYINSLLA
jgi:hypothetical protein